MAYLDDVIQNHFPVDVHAGKRSLEVRPRNVTKATFVRAVLSAVTEASSATDSGEGGNAADMSVLSTSPLSAGGGGAMWPGPAPAGRRPGVPLRRASATDLTIVSSSSSSVVDRVPSTSAVLAPETSESKSPHSPIVIAQSPVSTVAAAAVRVWRRRSVAAEPACGGDGSHGGPDMVLCVGGDVTDERLFEILPAAATTMLGRCVGASVARGCQGGGGLILTLGQIKCGPWHGGRAPLATASSARARLARPRRRPPPAASRPRPTWCGSCAWPLEALPPTSGLSTRRRRELAQALCRPR